MFVRTILHSTSMIIKKCSPGPSKLTGRQRFLPLLFGSLHCQFIVDVSGQQSESLEHGLYAQAFPSDSMAEITFKSLTKNKGAIISYRERGTVCL